MRRKVHGQRALLNLPGHHSTAAIAAEIENSAHWKPGVGRNGGEASRYNITPNILCKITDCDSSVDIEFDIDTANSRENTLHKLDTMIDALKAFRKGVVTESARFEARLAAMPPEKRHGI